MKTIYFVRHGENKANLTREFSYKKVDYPLTEKGVAQAKATATVLRGKGICAIYSSPLKRALETAEIIGKLLGLNVTPVEQFREVNVGALEGREPTEESWSIYNRVMKDWFEGRRASRFPEGENYLELVDRVRKGLSEVLNNDRDCANVVVVAHGGILLATMSDLWENTKGLDFRTWENCAITTAVFGDELLAAGRTLRGRIISWRDCTHLP